MTEEPSSTQVSDTKSVPAKGTCNREFGLLPLDGSDPYVYSQTIGTPPLSYVKGQNYSQDSPPPTYLSLEELHPYRSTQASDILYNSYRDSKGGLVSTDRNIIKKQRGVVTDLVKNILKNFASGLGMARITLPIKIFEPRSYVERLLDKFSLAPVFLNGLEPNLLLRFLKVVASCVGTMYISISQAKPFNPILGETFQGRYSDGSLVYVEHISHHPPIDCFLIVGEDYKIYGHYQLEGKFKGNNLIGSLVGPTFVEFQDGQLIEYTQPSFKLGGMLFGSRTLNYTGEFHFWDKSNSIHSKLKVGSSNSFFKKKDKLKLDELSGKVFVNKKEIGLLKGNWLKNLLFEVKDYQKELWNIEKHEPVWHTKEENPLPSDWRYREDLIWLSRGNTEYAGNWKYRLELQQRNEHLLRNNS